MILYWSDFLPINEQVCAQSTVMVWTKIHEFLDLCGTEELAQGYSNRNGIPVIPLY